jgi:hypothetical protein
MPLVNTPNGSFYIDDNASPDAIAAAKQDFMRTHQRKVSAAPPPPKLSAEQQEVQRRVAAGRKVNQSGIFGETGAGILRKAAQGFTFNLMDEGIGAAHALGKVFQGKDAMEREYRIARDTERQLNETQANGTGGAIAEIAGALANPIGTGAKALQFIGKAGKFAAPVAKIGQRLERAPAVVQGIAAGANQGALNAVGADESANGVGDLVTRAGQGAIAGGIGGGVLGAATTGVRRAAQILSDRAPAAAERVAYGKIGNMLERAGVTPARAEREIAVTNARGGDAVLGDMSPGLASQTGALAKRPDVAPSNDMIKRSRGRLADRGERFDAELRRHVGNADADAHIDAINAARKGQGKVDYEQALDGKFHWNQQLQDFVDKADPEIHDAFRKGAHLASLHDQDIAQLGMKIGEDGKPIITSTTPSMRVFDYTKRAMDTKIGAALRAGDEPLAAGLSNQLGKFKQMIMGANPDYAPALAKQRDAFERVSATQLGLDVVSRMRKEPRKVLKELQALDPSKHADARQGIADALIDLRTQKVDPVAFLQSVSRSPEQRKILEFMFNGKGNLGRFRRFMDRETRTADTDKLVAPGYQSATHAYKMADESLGAGDDLMGIAEHGLRGGAFGGPAGASAGITRKFMDLKNNMSPSALDAMAQALMSDGKGVAEKVSAARTYAKVRKARNAKYAIKAAKAGQQPFTDYAGE